MKRTIGIALVLGAAALEGPAGPAHAYQNVLLVPAQRVEDRAGEHELLVQFVDAVLQKRAALAHVGDAVRERQLAGAAEGVPLQRDVERVGGLAAGALALPGLLRSLPAGSLRPRQGETVLLRDRLLALRDRLLAAAALPAN